MSESDPMSAQAGDSSATGNSGRWFWPAGRQGRLWVVCAAVALVGVIVLSVIVLTRPWPGTYPAVDDICGHVDLAPLEDVGLVPDNGTGEPDPSAVPGSAGERITACRFEIDDMSAPADDSTCRCHLRLWAATHPDPARATTAMDRQITERGGTRTGAPYNPKDRGVAPTAG